MRRFLFSLMALVVVATSMPAVAFDAASDVPLVIIRFNQRKVMYDRLLYNAIAKAVQAKPDVVLDVVSFVPRTGDSRTDERIKDNALTQTSEVVKTLRSMGIPEARMHVSREGSGNIRFHEVHVYVD